MSNLRIICVDDEEGILEAYLSILGVAKVPPPTIVSSRNRDAQAGPSPKNAPAYEITCCPTGEDALEKIALSMSTGKPFAAGFFDVKLGPGIDGIETIRRAQKLDPSLLVCICSAYQDRALEEIAKIFGEDFDGQWDFLLKPFSSMEIAQKAKNMVSNWEWRRGRRSAA